MAIEIRELTITPTPHAAATVPPPAPAHAPGKGTDSPSIAAAVRRLLAVEAAQADRMRAD